MSRYQAMLDPAACEYCGGVVSLSGVKGDASNPIRAGGHSPCARFFHTECQTVFEEMYVMPRFQRDLSDDESGLAQAQAVRP